MRKNLLTLLVVCILTGCEGPTDLSPRLVIATSGTVYEIAEEIPIPYSITNASSHDTYHVFSCDQQPMVAMELRDEGDWVPYGMPWCIAVLPMVPISIGPGESRDFVTVLRANTPGPFRLRLTATADLAVPGYLEVSNTFQLR